MQPVEAIAAVEVPFRTKVMVKAGHSEMGLIGNRVIAPERQLIDAVAEF